MSNAHWLSEGLLIWYSRSQTSNIPLGLHPPDQIVLVSITIVIFTLSMIVLSLVWPPSPGLNAPSNKTFYLTTKPSENMREKTANICFYQKNLTSSGTFQILEISDTGSNRVYGNFYSWWWGSSLFISANRQSGHSSHAW